MCTLFVYVHTGICSCGGQRSILGVFLHHYPPFMKARSLTEPIAPQFGWTAWPASPEVFLSPPPQRWYCRCMLQQCPVAYVGAGNPNTGSRV